MGRFKPKAPSLISVLQALEGVPVTIELRNETYISGYIESVDARMNVVLQDVFMGKYLPNSKWSEQERSSNLEQDATFPSQFDVLQVNSRNIRFVHLPADIDIVKALEYQEQYLQKVRQMYRRGIRK